jgi:putative membrane protein
MRFFVRWFINAVALLAAAFVVPGIRLSASATSPGLNEWMTLAIVALIFGLINAIIRPVVFFLTLPLTILTLGLFMFVINALMLLLTSQIAHALHLGFRVEGFGSALLGALVISVVSFLLGRLLISERV